MKILIVHRYLEIYGGAENVINRFCRILLDEEGIDYKVVALNLPATDDETRKIYGNLKVEIPHGQKFPSVYRSAGFLKALGIFGEIAALRRLIKKNIAFYDVINVHNFPATWAIAGLAKNRKNNKPVVWMCNETPDFYSNPSPSLFIRILRFFGIFIDRLIVNSSIDRIVAADRINASKVKKVYGRDCEIIPYGIDTDIFSPSVKQHRDAVRKKWNIDDKDFVLLQTGVLSPQKNQIESVMALMRLKEMKVKSRLILAGKYDTPYYYRTLEPFISDNNLAGDVILTGHITKTELALLYGAVDLCLFPVKEQGGWLSPFEALGCAAPVVISPTMGAADLLNETHFCTITEDIPSAAVEIYNNYAEYLGRSTSASEWIKNNLTWQRYTKNFIRVFEEIKNEFMSEGV